MVKRTSPTLSDAQGQAQDRTNDRTSGVGDVRGFRGSSTAFISRLFPTPYALPCKPDTAPATLQNVDGSIASGIVGWNA